MERFIKRHIKKVIKKPSKQTNINNIFFFKSKFLWMPYNFSKVSLLGVDVAYCLLFELTFGEGS